MTWLTSSIEGETIIGSDSVRCEHTTIGHQHPPHLRPAFGLRAWLTLGMLLALLVSGAACVTPPQETPFQAQVTHVLSVAAPVASISAASLVPSPSPFTAPTGLTLLPMPTRCPVGGPQGQLPNLVPVVGISSVWATLPLQIHELADSGSPTDLFQPTYGWRWKIICEIGPHYQQPVTVWGENLTGTQRLSFQGRDEPIRQRWVLDSRHPNHPISAESPAGLPLAFRNS
ncbi:hypothetical protein [Thermogemmatispora sp.]|uniref:hypothetical protein n=1 Tax=Thermogemmatispora sp. TaxID=1968838 RepID=UPI001D95EAE4|nr:hypothetical protein [Thermogemmatispora sp.]MBX5449365.1 hypothetical protein [Thermogemmatispora sp.]